MGYREAYNRTLACAGLAKTADENRGYGVGDALKRPFKDPLSAVPVVGEIRDIMNNDVGAGNALAGSTLGSVPGFFTGFLGATGTTAGAQALIKALTKRNVDFDPTIVGMAGTPIGESAGRSYVQGKLLSQEHPDLSGDEINRIMAKKEQTPDAQ